MTGPLDTIISLFRLLSYFNFLKAFFIQDAAHLSKDSVLVNALDGQQGGYLTVCPALSRCISSWCGLRSCSETRLLLSLLLLLLGFRFLVSFGVTDFWELLPHAETSKF